MENNNKHYYPTSIQFQSIKKIESLGGQYDPNSNLPLEDQLFICEILANATPKENEIGDHYQHNTAIDKNVAVNGNVNDSYKQSTKFELTPSKIQVISKLNQCNYKTPPVEISRLLNEFFKECNSYYWYWSYIARAYSPRTINWNLKYIVKLIISGRRTFENPAAYFSKTIKFRKKRKEFRKTNDTR